MWQQPAGKKNWSKNCLVPLCFKCFKFKYFRMHDGFLPTKLRGTKQNKPDLHFCSRSTNEIFSEPVSRKNKNGEKTVAVNRLA